VAQRAHCRTATSRRALYVRLSVSDHRQWNAAQVLERYVRPPFFTTKGAAREPAWACPGARIVGGSGGRSTFARTVAAATTFTIWLPIAGEAPSLRLWSPQSCARRWANGHDRRRRESAVADEERWAELALLSVVDAALQAFFVKRGSASTPS